MGNCGDLLWLPGELRCGEGRKKQKVQALSSPDSIMKLLGTLTLQRVFL